MEPPDGVSPVGIQPQATLHNGASSSMGVTTGKQTFATTVSMANQTSKTIRHPRESVIAKITTHNGIPAVIFKATDYYGIMADECKFTIVGRFLKTRPQIDRISSSFKELFAIRGSVKIGVYDNHNVFLDFTNEDDFNMVWYRRVIEMEGLQLWLQKWTPDFNPEEDIPVAPVWVLLPGLTFHMHTWHSIKQIVSLVGTPLGMDGATTATNGRTRPSMAKIRVEVDLLKPQPNTVWVGLEDDKCPLRGFNQKLEYENIPKYCKHCRKMGHNVMNCWILEKIRSNDKKGSVLKENQADVNWRIVRRILARLRWYKKSKKILMRRILARLRLYKKSKKILMRSKLWQRNLVRSRAKSEVRRRKRFQKKRSKVTFKPAISSIKRSRIKKHNDRQQRTETVEHVEPSESVELVEVGQSQKIVVAENSTNISEGNGTRKNDDTMVDNTDKRVENTHQKEKSDDNEKIISTNLPRELINQEPVELNL
ncbi:hypothetical protein R3W88_026656 [Solanum pinnatisectum]|uniref:DUF4283 domain-containing protein n=1 Tax=Solanum pinnatisectum TaxID=50273 RepID=A0AAV9LDY9_9SOLN|nr:hypothetical protein R3W88_026656 [Solanum pinnatisectum]